MAALVWSALPPSVVVAGPVSPVAPPLAEVRASGGLLTVDVRGVPLAQVLRAIGEQADVRMTLRGDLEVPVTDAFSGLPLEEGLRRLARGFSVTVTYAEAADAPGGDRLAAAWIIASSGTRGSVGTVARAVEPSQQGGGPATASAPSVTSGSEANAPEATKHFPVGGWLSGIQALADEANQGSERAIAVLTDISLTEPAAVVRQQGVAALGRLKGPDVEPALTAALADDDASVRVRAVRGLRGTGTTTAVQALAGALRDDADPSVRLAALDALMSYPGRTMLRGLAGAAADPDARVRDAAARGLAWWNTRPSGAP